MALKKVNDVNLLEDTYDLAIVGGGPAGMAAAVEAAGANARTIIFDENPAAGGQIYRAIEKNMPETRSFLGKDYWKGKGILQAFLSSSATYVSQALVWSVSQSETEADGSVELRVSANGQSKILHARRVILATGAMERPMPVQGWTLPGVMPIGAAQIALKAAGLLPEGRVVLAGSGPLLYLFASQVLEAGGNLVAVLDTTPRLNWLKAIHFLPGFLVSPYFLKGMSLLRKVRQSARVFTGVNMVEIVGSKRANSVRFRVNGDIKEFGVDSVFLHQGIVPNNSLANATGCELEWNNRQSCFQPQLNSDGRSSLPAIFVAGDGGGIGGAHAAEVSGRISALGACLDLFPENASKIQSLLSRRRRQLRSLLRGRAFIDTLYQPDSAFRAPVDRNIIACRCEEVRVGEIRDAAARNVLGPNQLKTMLRCGMGPCQGRMCASTVTEILAEVQHRSPSDIGTYRIRTPLKPIPLREIAALPLTSDAIYAVTGARPDHN